MDRARKFRDNGTIGALLDEYEKALMELKDVINSVSERELIEIIDHETKDADCKSIQTILTHVIQCGYLYVVEIRKWQGEEIEYNEKTALTNIEAYQLAIEEMFRFNETLFVDYPNLPLYELNPSQKIKTRWGQIFDVEQLFSHAIVHVLKHRRQIERFKIKMAFQNI